MRSSLNALYPRYSVTRLNRSALAYFQAFYRRRSLGHAGRDVGRTKSGLCRSMKKLEQDLGVRLYYRCRWKVRFTGAAHELYPLVCKILVDMDHATTTARYRRRHPLKSHYHRKDPLCSYAMPPRSIRAWEELAKSKKLTSAEGWRDFLARDGKPHRLHTRSGKSS